MQMTKDYNAEAERMALGAIKQIDKRTYKAAALVDYLGLADLLRAKDELEHLFKSLGCSTIEGATETLDTMQAQVAKLKEELDDAKLPSVEHIQEIYALTDARAKGIEL